MPCIDPGTLSEKRLSNVSINGTISSQKVRLLVDTGAAISVAGESFNYDVLRASFYLKKSETISTIKSADGSTSPVSGLVSFIGDARPIKWPPYRVSQSQRAEIKMQINTMLEQEVIRVSSSPWRFPVVLVKKKDETTRFCLDYRKLNVTLKDRVEALDALSGAKFFTTLDLQSGYYQVAMDINSFEKTAFISHAGLYEYNVMSFGLTNAEL